MRALDGTTVAERAGQAWIVKLKERLRQGAQFVLAPVVRGLARGGVRPDFLTVTGCALSLCAALAFFVGAFRWGSLLLAMGGVCDVLDGQLARELGTESKFGAFLDSTLDRLGEALILSGIAGFYVFHLPELLSDPSLVYAELRRGLTPWTWARVSLIAVLALVGAFLVSYTRARAEGLGLQCRVGWVERPERLVALIFAGAFGVSVVMPWVLLFLILSSFATTAQRVTYVWKTTRTLSRDPGTDR
jgi:CDP-diacylglycerol--glycerol-3-phosphate 3-phosphatidyltransferase